MIYIDEEKLDLTGGVDKGTPTEIIVKQAIMKIRDNYGKRMPLVFNFSEHLKFQKKITSDFVNTQVIDCYPSQRMIICEVPVMINGTRVSVRYVESVERSNGENNYKPRKIVFNGNMKINDTELDKAFYMLFCYNDISGGMQCSEITRIEPRIASRATIQFIDHAQINEEKFAFEKIKATVLNSILNDISNENIKQCAMLYSISNAHDKDAKVLRTDLLERLAILDKMSDPIENVYADFSVKFHKMMNKDVALTTEALVKGMMAQAKELGILREVNTKNGKAWYYWDAAKGVRVSKVCDIIGNITAEQTLINLMSADENERKALDMAVSNEIARLG